MSCIDSKFSKINNEDNVNKMLESGINRINNILNYSYDKKFYNDNFSHDFDKINSYTDKELSEILRETRIRNNELLHIITLQKSDFYELEKKYVNLSDEYNMFLDRFDYSEKIRMEQMNLIKSMQDKLDEIRGVDNIINQNNELATNSEFKGSNLSKNKTGTKTSMNINNNNYNKSNKTLGCFTKNISTSRSTGKIKK